MNTNQPFQRVMFVLVCVLSLCFTTARAQNTVFTYQGRVTSGGTNFSGAGQFKFALVTSTNFSRQATATANPPSGGFITIINVTFGGAGYVTPPAVTVSGGGGSGVTAHANISGGTVTSIVVDNPGSGYTSTPGVTVAAPPPNIAYTTYWSNDGTSVAGSEPSAAVSITVSSGLFTAVLGDTSQANMGAITAALFTQPSLQLRIWFNDGVHGFAALNPPQNLTPAPYAIQAGNAATASLATVANSANSVSGANITGTVPFAHLPPSLVTNNEVAVNLTGTFTGNGGALSNLSPNAMVLVSSNLSITAWGFNAQGQTTLPAGLNNPVAAAGGLYHSLALKADGTVVCWGAGQTYDPSNGVNFAQSIVPPGLSNVTAIGAGIFHSLALKADHTIAAWGAGQVYNTNTTFELGQCIVPAGLTNVIAVSGGYVHTLALRSNGTVVAWGGGTNTVPTGGLDAGQSVVPPGLSNVTAISAGLVHSLALRSNGTVVAWGAGQTNAGNGVDFGQSIVPPGLSNVVAIAAGGLHNMVLKSDGTVVAWGAGITNSGISFDFGQSIVPAGLSNVVAISAGISHSMALKSDGTIVIWGDNTHGQTNAPPGLDNVVSLITGSEAYHVMVLRRHSTAPVAWLDSDNTFTGNIQVNGALGVAGDLQLNDGTLWLRTTNQYNGLGWYGGGKSFAGLPSGAPDGPVLFGNSGGALGTSTTTNGQQVALFWDASHHVGIGTLTPNAKLSLGSDSANSKLLLVDGYGSVGLGGGGGQLMLNLGGSGGRFSFMDAPGGTELVSIASYGSLGIGTTTPGSKLDVRGIIRFGPSGQYLVPGAQETLYIVRGVVRGDGVILAGTGFSVVHTGVGAYTVTFSPAFSDMPAVTATVQHGTAQSVTTSSVTSTTAYIGTWNPNGSASDQWFHFIAMGQP